MTHIKRPRIDYDVGKELLGPILYDYCNRLHQFFIALRGRDAVALFMARGGLRLHHLYCAYCEKNNLSLPLPVHSFFISRFAAARGCLLSDIEYVSPIIIREFRGQTIAAMLEALLPGAKFEDESLEVTVTGPIDLIALLERGDLVGQQLRGFLHEQATLLRDYVNGLIDGSRQVALIDTGWTGNTQAMLMRAFPELDWLGFYFGRWDYRREQPSHFSNVIGVAVDGTTYDPLKPATALFAYHHLIEGVLEVPVRSTSYYIRDEATGQITADGEVEGLALAILPASSEGMFQGVIDYFSEVKSEISGRDIALRALPAYRMLQQMIFYPHRDDYKAMLVAQRSSDFGRSSQVPILVPGAAGKGLRVRFDRMRQSLWVQGQIVQDWGRLAPPLLYLVHLLLLFQFIFEQSRSIRKRLCAVGGL